MLKSIVSFILLSILSGITNKAQEEEKEVFWKIILYICSLVSSFFAGSISIIRIFPLVSNGKSLTTILFVASAVILHIFFGIIGMFISQSLWVEEKKT